MTPAQIAILKSAVWAEPTLATALATGDDWVVFAWLNADSAMYIWKTGVSTQDVFDKITWANFTPQDVPDGTTLWTNRSLQCQGKQFNVQTMLVGRESINPSKPNIRAGLQDALTALPSGAGGASRAAGWTGLQTILYRIAKRVEILLASGSGTTAAPSLMTYEGDIDINTVSMLR